VDSDQRAMRHMKLPERGTLQVTGVHDGHSHSKISGVIRAPGIAPTRVEHKVDERGRVSIGQELPVLVDCADPSRFAILWDEAGSATFAPPSFQYGPGADVSSTVVAIGPDGQPYSALPPDMAARVEAALDQAFSQRGRSMPPGMAARVEQALDRALGQAGLQGQGISEAISQALGRASGQQSYGAAGAPPFGQVGAQPFDPQAGSPYGPGGAQPSAPAAGPSYDQGGQWGAQPYAQDATGFPEVSWTDQGGSGVGPQGGFNSAQPAQPPAGGGEVASAIVLAAQDVAPRPGFAAPGAAVDLTLEVRRADGSVYTARTTLSVPTPEGRAAVATPGTRLSVRIDPTNPARVEIDPYGRF
jgi:hypothetical protein